MGPQGQYRTSTSLALQTLTLTRSGQHDPRDINSARYLRAVEEMADHRKPASSQALSNEATCMNVTFQNPVNRATQT